MRNDSDLLKNRSPLSLLPHYSLFPPSIDLRKAFFYTEILHDIAPSDCHFFCADI